MAKLKTYDMKQVSVVYAGRILTGAADGDFVTVEMSSDAWSHHVGASGEECRAKTNDESGKITVKLAQWSSDNAVLAGLHLADKAAGSGVAPIAVVDKSGKSLHGSDEAYILKAPNAPYAKAPGDREWVFMCAGLSHFVGGN